MAGMKTGLFMGVMGALGVWARPTGAPGCDVNAVQKMTGDVDQSQDLGFTMTVNPQQYSPEGGELEIQMSGPTMKGLLIYLTSQDAQTMRIGEFVDFNGENWKSNSENCQNGLECPSSACALTHTSGADKQPPTLKLNYPPGQSGSLILRAAVVTTSDGQTYQKLQEVEIQPNGNAGGNLDDMMQSPIPDAPPLGGGNCNCQPVKRCKKWKGQSPSGGLPYAPGGSPAPAPIGGNGIPALPGASQESDPSTEQATTEESTSESNSTDSSLQERVQQLSSESPASTHTSSSFLKTLALISTSLYLIL